MSSVSDNEYYLGTKITNIPIPTFKEMLKNKIISILEDNGQGNITPDDVKYMCVRIYETLTNKYRSFRWLEVKRTLERGLEEDFGKFTRITVKVLLTWFKRSEEELRHNQDRMQDSKRIKPDLEKCCNPKDTGRWAKFVRFSIAREIPDDIYNNMTLEAFEKGEYDNYPLKDKSKYPLLKSI